MKKFLLFLGGLTLIAALAEAIVLLQLPLDPRRLGAFLLSLALVLTVFVAFAIPGFVRFLRRLVSRSAVVALGLPLLLLIPYLILACGTGTFSVLGIAKLVAYIAAPTALVLPDRLRRAERVGWRDLGAMLALAVPVSAGWLTGIWTWPQELYFFRPLFCVAVGAYDFMVVRNLEDVGYSLLPRKNDAVHGLANFVAFATLAIPLGYALRFIAFRPHVVSPSDLLLRFLGIYLSIAVPEELLFRGILQNFLARSFTGPARSVYALLIASVIFGAAHLHHAPIPNWRYAILAALAGVFYGNAYRARRRLAASALTHTLVDTVWRFWF